MKIQWLLLFLFVIHISFSTDYLMNIEADNTGLCSVVSEISSADPGEISFCYLGELSDIKITDKSGLQLTPQTTAEGDYTCISFAVPYDYAKISFSSYDFTSKNASLWGFQMKMYSSENIDSFSSSLVLPSGSTLQKTTGQVSSSGSALVVAWNTNNITASRVFNLSADYEIDPVEEYGTWIILIIIIVIVLGAAHIYYRIRPKTEPEAKSETTKPETRHPKPKPEEWLESNEVFKTLDEVDKEIVREIAKQKGKTTQAKIYLNTHIPKATLSRRLNSLENREIIEKSQKGNRNLISLKLGKK